MKTFFLVVFVATELYIFGETSRETAVLAYFSTKNHRFQMLVSTFVRVKPMDIFNDTLQYYPAVFVATKLHIFDESLSDRSLFKPAFQHT